MRVTAVEATPFEIPLRHPIGFATGTLHSAQHVLVQVRTADGTVGTAEAVPRPMVYGETVRSVLAAIEDLVRPHILGRDILALEHLPDDLRNVAGNPTAKSAVELAIMDAAGQCLGVPCHRLLGGGPPSVRCTVLLGWGRPDEVAGQAADARERLGVTAFKMKAGIDLQVDIATAHALRRRVGADALIYADANHGFTAAEAGRFLHAVEDADLAWFEEPCPAGDVLGRGRLCASSAIPIVGDESCPDLPSVAVEVLDQRSTMISIKIARTGVITSRRIAAFCQATGAEVVVGSQGDSGIGTLAGAAVAAALPHAARNPAELLYFLDLREDLLGDPPVIEDGMLALTDAPGFGIALDHARLERLATGPARVIT